MTDRTCEEGKGARAGILWAALVFVILLQQISTMDYWTHLALGRAMWEAHSVRIAEPFLLGARGSPLTPPSWAFELLLYGVYRGLGHAGVCVFVAGLGAGAFALLGRRSSAAGGGRAVVGWVFLACVAFASRARFVPRPEVLGYVVAGAALPLAYAWSERPRLSRLWVLGFLLAAWAVLHPTWAIGVTVTAGYLLTRPRFDFWRAAWRDPRGRPQIAALAALAAAAAVPAGRFALRVADDLFKGGSLAAVTEMQPMWSYPEVLWPFLATMGAALWCVWAGQEGRIRRLILWCGALALGLAVARNISLALIAVAVPALDGVARADARWLGRLAGKRGGVVMAAASALLLLLAVRSADPRWGTGVRWELFPREAAEFSRRAGLPGPVLNSFDIGGYLDWAWAGEPPTFIDGRVMGENPAFADLRAVTEAISPESVLERHRVQTILIRTMYADSGRLFPLVSWLLAQPAWRLVNSSDALVFTRAASPRVPTVPTAGAWRFVLREAQVKAAQGGAAPHLPYTLALAWFELGDLGRAKLALEEGLRGHPEVAPAYAGATSAFGFR